jgi:hypothetical protein
VRPGCVVVLQVFGQYLVQVVLIDDQQPVKELAAQGADQSLADGVGSGCLWRAGENPDAYGGEHRVEGVRVPGNRSHLSSFGYRAGVPAGSLDQLADRDERGGEVQIEDHDSGPAAVRGARPATAGSR